MLWAEGLIFNNFALSSENVYNRMAKFMHNTIFILEKTYGNIGLIPALTQYGVLGGGNETVVKSQPVKADVIYVTSPPIGWEMAIALPPHEISFTTKTASLYWNKTQSASTVILLSRKSKRWSIYVTLRGRAHHPARGGIIGNTGHL